MAQLYSESVCNKIDDNYCLKSIFSAPTTLKPFNCTSTCQRNFYKTVFNQKTFWEYDLNRTVSGWTNNNYTTCPLKEDLEYCAVVNKKTSDASQLVYASIAMVVLLVCL